MREIAVFGSSAHPALAAEICTHLTVPQVTLGSVVDAVRLLMSLDLADGSGAPAAKPPG